MFHQKLKKQDSNPLSQIRRLSTRASEIIANARDYCHRLASLEEVDSVEGQSRSFRIWMFSSFGALVCILLLNLSARSNEVKPSSANSTQTEDLVSQLPTGHVLVPIEPMNLDAIDAVFGQHGWADLFIEREEVDTAFRNSGKPARRRIAVGVPLIRAPRNPSRLAVIVSESETQLISELGQPVHVALRKSPANGKSAHKPALAVRRARFRHPSIQLELVHEDGIEDSN